MKMIVMIYKGSLSLKSLFFSNQLLTKRLIFCKFTRTCE